MKVVKEAKAQAKNEIQTATLGIFSLGSLIQLTDLNQNLNANFDTVTNILLAVVVAVSATVALFGSYDTDIKPGFILELGGWIGITSCFCVYLSGAVWYNPNWYSAVSTYFFVGFIIGAALRSRKIVLALRRLSALKRHEIEPEE